MKSAASYENDVVARPTEQERLLREGRLDQLDIAHLAKEIEDVGQSEQRELANRFALLLAHLLKWQIRPGRRGGEPAAHHPPQKIGDFFGTWWR